MVDFSVFSELFQCVHLHVTRSCGVSGEVVARPSTAVETDGDRRQTDGESSSLEVDQAATDAGLGQLEDSCQVAAEGSPLQDDQPDNAAGNSNLLINVCLLFSFHSIPIFPSWTPSPTVNLTCHICIIV